MLDLKTIRYFVAVADGGSLTKIATHLHISHSILSREISNLEDSLGARLFHRTGRGMKVTEFGRQLLPRARSLVDEASKFSDEASNLRGKVSGTVRVGVPGSAAALVAARLLKATQQHHPDLFLRFVEGRSAVTDELLAAGDIDVALSYSVKRHVRRGDIMLSSSSLYLVGPPNDELTSKNFVPLAMLAKRPLLLPSRPHAVRTMIEDAFATAGYELRVFCEVDSLLVQKELVSARVGLTVCLYDAIAEDLQARRLQATQIRNPEISTILVMRVAPKNALTTAARALASLVITVSRALVAEGIWRSPT